MERSQHPGEFSGHLPTRYLELGEAIPERRLIALFREREFPRAAVAACSYTGAISCG
jgi:hypothetical protein